MGYYSNNLIDKAGTTVIHPPVIKSFKQFQVQETVKIHNSCPDIGQVMDSSPEVEIVRSSIIPISKSVSYEGRILTGMELIVEGRLVQRIEYMTSDESQSIHITCFVQHFTTHIVLDETFTCESELDITSYIEDLYVKKINERTLFISALILINILPQRSF